MGFQSESQAAERETNTTQTLSNELKKALTVTCKETGKTATLTGIGAVELHFLKKEKKPKHATRHFKRDLSR